MKPVQPTAIQKLKTDDKCPGSLCTHEKTTNPSTIPESMLIKNLEHRNMHLKVSIFRDKMPSGLMKAGPFRVTISSVRELNQHTAFNPGYGNNLFLSNAGGLSLNYTKLISKEQQILKMNTPECHIHFYAII